MITRLERLPQPLWPQMINAAGRALHRVGAAPEPFDAFALIEDARRRAGFDDFGPAPLVEPLQVLLSAYREEAQLSFLGRLSARRHLQRLLEARLAVEADRVRIPAIAEERISRPLVIFGLPRSGTTLLHRLLALDPDNSVPRVWEATAPSPPPGPASENDPRIARVDRQLRWLTRLSPEVRTAHPLEARLPQECVALLAYSLQSPQFHTTHHVPSYKAWLERQDPRPAYAYHRRMLQHLQWRRPGRRWVLKAPAHLFALDALCTTYPDAVLVQCHRDPRPALASTASLIAALRRAFSETVEPRRFGPVLIERWAAGLERAAELRAADAELERRTLDLQHAEIMRDPVGAIRRIYAHWQLPLSDRAAAHMRRFAAANPRDKNGVHRYSAADFGLDGPEVQERFAGYRERFRVAPETPV